MNIVKKYMNFMFKLLFPERCLWCDKVIGFTDCPECENKASKQKLKDSWIKQDEWGRAYPLPENILSSYVYAPPVTDAVIRMKNAKQAELAYRFAKTMAKTYQESFLMGWPDLIIPVPLHKSKLRKRGYNQSLLLAQNLAKLTKIPLADTVLVKKRQTLSQVDLSRQERLSNLKGSFEVKKPATIQNKKILLVDDVITTGSTLYECSLTLLRAGAAASSAICIATTRPPGQQGD